MAGKFENTKPPKPKVPGAPRKGAAAPQPNPEGNREQRRAAARKKGKGLATPSTPEPVQEPGGAGGAGPAAGAPSGTP